MSNSKVFNINMDEMLLLAVLEGQLSNIRLILQTGANVDFQTDTGLTALMLACKRDFDTDIDDLLQEDIVVCLLNAGAAVNLTDKYGRTCLMLACKNGCSIRLPDILLQCGADIRMKDKRSITALQYAVRSGHSDIIKCLQNIYLMRKADVRNNFRNVSFSKVEQEGHLKQRQINYETQAQSSFQMPLITKSNQLRKPIYNGMEIKESMVKEWKLNKIHNDNRFQRSDGGDHNTCPKKSSIVGGSFHKQTSPDERIKSPSCSGEEMAKLLPYNDLKYHFEVKSNVDEVGKFHEHDGRKTTNDETMARRTYKSDNSDNASNIFGIAEEFCKETVEIGINRPGERLMMFINESVMRSNKDHHSSTVYVTQKGDAQSRDVADIRGKKSHLDLQTNENGECDRNSLYQRSSSKWNNGIRGKLLRRRMQSAPEMASNEDDQKQPIHAANQRNSVHVGYRPDSKHDEDAEFDRQFLKHKTQSTSNRTPLQSAFRSRLHTTPESSNDKYERQTLKLPPINRLR